jgi:DNA-binding IclR family transcriptional regulator
MQVLRQELQKVRERGYALNLGEHLEEVYAIGVPVNGEDGGPVAAVTVAGPVSRWNRKALRALTPRVAGTAAEITHALTGQQAADGSAGESAPADAHVRA